MTDTLPGGVLYDDALRIVAEWDRMPLTKRAVLRGIAPDLAAQCEVASAHAAELRRPARPWQQWTPFEDLFGRGRRR